MRVAIIALVAKYSAPRRKQKLEEGGGRVQYHTSSTSSEEVPSPRQEVNKTCHFWHSSNVGASIIWLWLNVADCCVCLWQMQPMDSSQPLLISVVLEQRSCCLLKQTVLVVPDMMLSESEWPNLQKLQHYLMKMTMTTPTLRPVVPSLPSSTNKYIFPSSSCVAPPRWPCSTLYWTLVPCTVCPATPPSTLLENRLSFIGQPAPGLPVLKGPCVAPRRMIMRISTPPWTYWHSLLCHLGKLHAVTHLSIWPLSTNAAMPWRVLNQCVFRNHACCPRVSSVLVIDVIANISLIHLYRDQCLSIAAGYAG